MSEQNSSRTRRGRGAKSATAGSAAVVEPELTDEEKYEAELAEKARQDGGGWDSVAPGKADNFGKSFSRMIGLLKPSAVWFVIVSILGAIGVVLKIGRASCRGRV